jgi:glycosyltransferase involved in cell wall biosynthesis
MHVKAEQAGPEVSFIIPAYNEAKILPAHIGELKDWLAANMSDLVYEIIVVDDGSTDGMGDAVEALAADDPRLRVARHGCNLGRGRALRTGFEESAGEFVISLDADLSYSPDHIPKLLEPLRQGKADITLASAYHPDGSVSNVPFSRALMSRWANRLMRTGVHGLVHTVTCMVRGYRREAIDELELINDGKEIHLEIVQKAILFGLRVYEVPAHLHWRERERRKTGPKTLLGRIPFLSMSRTIVSHLVYNYMLRPGSLFMVPVVMLVSAVLGGIAMLCVGWTLKLQAWSGGVSLSVLYRTFRDTLLEGQLTVAATVACFLTLLIFVSFYFSSQQNKKNFEELYVMLARMNARIKHLEKREHR